MTVRHMRAALGQSPRKPAEAARTDAALPVVGPASSSPLSRGSSAMADDSSSAVAEKPVDELEAWLAAMARSDADDHQTVCMVCPSATALPDDALVDAQAAAPPVTAEAIVAAVAGGETSTALEAMTNYVGDVNRRLETIERSVPGRGASTPGFSTPAVPAHANPALQPLEGDTPETRRLSSISLLASTPSMPAARAVASSAPPAVKPLPSPAELMAKATATYEEKLRKQAEKIAALTAHPVRAWLGQRASSAITACLDFVRRILGGAFCDYARTLSWTQLLLHCAALYGFYPTLRAALLRLLMALLERLRTVLSSSAMRVVSAAVLALLGTATRGIAMAQQHVVPPMLAMAALVRQYGSVANPTVAASSELGAAVAAGSVPTLDAPGSFDSPRPALSPIAEDPAPPSAVMCVISSRLQQGGSPGSSDPASSLSSRLQQGGSPGSSDPASSLSCAAVSSVGPSRTQQGGYAAEAMQLGGHSPPEHTTPKFRIGDRVIISSYELGPIEKGPYIVKGCASDSKRQGDWSPYLYHLLGAGAEMPFIPESCLDLFGQLHVGMPVMLALKDGSFQLVGPFKVTARVNSIQIQLPVNEEINCKDESMTVRFPRGLYDIEKWHSSGDNAGHLRAIDYNMLVQITRDEASAMTANHLTSDEAYADLCHQLASMPQLDADGDLSMVARPSPRNCALPVHGAVAAVLPSDAILMDDGATINLSRTGLGRIPGTHNPASAGSFDIGDDSATLLSHGTHLHAFTRVAANGTEEDILRSMHDAPNALGNILSEGVEVRDYKYKLLWAPDGSPRTLIKDDVCYPMHMLPSGLGFYKIRPITSIAKLIALLHKHVDMVPPDVLAKVKAAYAITVISSLPPSTTRLIDGMSKAVTCKVRVRHMWCTHNLPGPWPP